MTSSHHSCLFCKIIDGEISAAIVFENDDALAFLDHRPLFHGHTLLIPKNHFETLNDLPAPLVGAFFSDAQLLARAIEQAMSAEGTFVAMNNRVSQSVPHFHVHLVPRRRKDGLKGFFWPRTKYESSEQIASVQDSIKTAVAELKKDS